MGQNNKSLEQFLQGKNLNQITSLNLSGEGYRSIPFVVFRCRNLRKLNLSHNNLTSIPKEIELLRKLKVLNVSNNKLTHIPAPVCRLPKLKSLDVSHNLIKTIPKQLGSSSIAVLIISDNRLETIDFCLIRNIEKLIINNNKIKSFNPGIILPLLKYLWIKGNPCTGKEQQVNIIQYLPNLKKYYAPANQNNLEIIPDIDMNENKPLKNKIFISYAHADEDWLTRLKINLKSLQKYVGGFDYWDDKRLRTGDRWKEEIEKALQSASAAILLVSPDFLASDFIANDELPPILERANTEGTKIFPVIVRRSLFNYSPLSSFQSVNPPEKPLKACPDAEVDEYLYKLMEDIIYKLKLDK